MMNPKRARPYVGNLLLTLALAACGGGASTGGNDAGVNGDGGTGEDGAPSQDGGIHDVDPVPIPGGGVTAGPLQGELNVFVLRAEDDAPIAGAAVRVGEPDDPVPLVAVTDASGLAVIVDAGLAGPATVTVSAPGRARATWFGVSGASATIPLAVTPTPELQTATLSGGIAGWDALPDPAFGHYRAAYVSYSHTEDPVGAENRIPQPNGSGNTAQNLCLFMAMVAENPCAWTLTTRVGPQVVYAVILDGDANGTQDPADDVRTVTGYAALRGVAPVAGQSIPDLVLEPLPENDLVDASMTFAGMPAGLDDVAGIPYLVTASEGRIPFWVFGPAAPDAPLPGLAGIFAADRYEVFGYATSPGDTDDRTSLTILRDVDIGAAVALEAWMAPPSALSAVDGTYGFTAAPGAQLHLATFGDGAGSPIWSVVLLDGRTSFTLPELTPDPWPSAEVTLAVTALLTSADLDPADFASRDLGATVTRTSLDTLIFVP